MLKGIPSKGRLIIDTEEGKFVFKPVEFFGEGFTTIPYNEEFAHTISDVLGLNSVPFTLVNDISVTFGNKSIPMRGSLQRFVEGEVLPLHLYRGNIDMTQATEIIVLDVLIGNTDRKEDNVLVDSQGKLWAIDNGYSLGFHASSEKLKRNGQDKKWDISMYSIEDCILNISSRLLHRLDQPYLEHLIGEIRSPEFFSGLQYSGSLENPLWVEITEMLRHRIKYLPTLVWRQTVFNEK